MFWILALIIFTVLVVLAFRHFSGVDERIRTFLRAYQHCRVDRQMTERQAMEAVCELHIPPGKARTLRALGMTGNTYMDQVFEHRELRLEKVVGLFIRLEFPDRYPMTLDLEAIRERNRKGLKHPEELLEERVLQLMAEMQRKVRS